MIHPRSCPKFQRFFLPFLSPLPLWSPWIYQSYIFFHSKVQCKLSTWTVYIRLNISTISSTSISPKQFNKPWTLCMSSLVQTNIKLNLPWSVLVIHPEGPSELLLRVATAGHVCGDHELLEVDAAVPVLVEDPEQLLHELFTSLPLNNNDKYVSMLASSGQVKVKGRLMP